MDGLNGISILIYEQYILKNNIIYIYIKRDLFIINYSDGLIGIYRHYHHHRYRYRCLLHI